MMRRLVSRRGSEGRARWPVTMLGLMFAVLAVACGPGGSEGPEDAEEGAPAPPEAETSEAAAGGVGTGPFFQGPVALQLYSLRESFAEEGVPATLAKVAAMGVTDVELAGTYDLSPEDFKAELDRAGLRPIAMHADFDQLREDPAPVIEEARLYGLTYVGAAWYPHEPPFDQAQAEEAIEAFNNVGRQLQAEGLTFFYHPHGYEFAAMDDDRTLFDLIVDETDREAVAFELDVFWAYHGGADPAALLRRYPDRFVLTHLKDMREGTERDTTGTAPDDSSVALGSGMLDLREILDAAKGARIAWHVIEEESSDPETNIPAGLRFLESLD